MRSRSPGRRALALGAVLAVVAPAAAQARDMYVTGDDGNLHRATLFGWTRPPTSCSC